MSDGAPTLEAGFEITTGTSFDVLGQLENAMDRATANIIAEANKVEKATGGMVNLGGATAEITSFGNASTRALRDAAKEADRAERDGERLLKQIARQNDAFGKSKAELRQMRVEERALAAERSGNADLARRLREQESELWGKEYYAARQASIARQNAAEDAAEAEVRAQAEVIAQLRERARLEAAIRDNTGLGQVRATDAGAGFTALAAQAAEEEARAKDLAAVANRRLTEEHARLAAAVRESYAAQEADAVAAERLRQATDPLYAATVRLNAEIAESTRLYYAGATAPEEYARQQMVLQQRLEETAAVHNRAAAAAGKNGFALTQLSFQLNDVITMAAMGANPFQILASQGGQVYQVFQMAEGGAAGLARQLGVLALGFAPLIAVAAVAVGGFALFNRAMSDVDTKPMVEGLGLTRAEIKRLKDTSVDTGDVMTATFQVLAERVGIDMSAIKGSFGDALDWMTEKGRQALANLYANWVGSFRAMREATNAFLEGGSLSDIGKAAADAYQGAFDEADAALKQFGSDVRQQVTDNKLADLRKQAAELKKDRSERVSAADRHAAQLAREAEAIEAQIRNLYNLADAYRASGAEALIAEARVKAESAAIKKRADIDAMVERQIRLAIAERVSDSAKAAAAVREQVEAQHAVNDMVAAGIVPSERAAELVQEQLADLPLLAALQVAQQRGYTDEILRATRALEDQRKAREDLRREEERAAFNSTMAVGANRLAELREEIRLIGATDAARARAMAALKAEQEASKMRPQFRADYVAQQMEIAEEQIRLAQQQADFNQELRFTADLFDVIHANASDAARGMSDAFGSAGSALGDLLTITTGYHAADERLRLERDARILEAGESEAAKIRENQLYALRSASLQVGAYGDMAAAAQGFFSKGSDGYKALAAAEKAFRAVEFAMSVRAIAQDAAETGAKLASGAARIATGATEAVVNAIKSLPFPLNLAAGAATVAALASIGVAVGGAFSGGGGNTLTPANDGSGTTLGDAEAQSQSIKRSIDALREVDLLTANHSRDMLVSLRSIDNQIGGFASLVLRTGNVNADLGITEGFQSDLTGKVLSGLVTGGGLFTKIPIIGGILGGIGGLLGSLFGSKKEVVGSGLFAGPQTLADILNGGFDASYYSDIKKTKKFLGVKTGTSYSTQYTNADAELENQFTLVLRGFNDAIAAAAGPLGVATSDIEKRLNGFVIDLGKIDTRDLTGTELQERLTAVFGAAADRMASAAFPGFEKFQHAGEGMFETLVRVASTVETVTGLFDQLGIAGGGIGIEAQLALVEQFDSLEDLTSATQSYFETFYTREEQAQAKLAQFTSAFDHMGITLPNTLAGFRALVEAQDLTTAAGRETYAMLLQVAPAFADLQSALNGARSAADILAERQDLERKLLELQGDTAALRELELAQIDVSNRALQQQIWAIEDAQEAAKAAEQLREAWSSVGDSIMDEVNRIRGLNGAGEGGSFAQLMGQFNAATSAARTGDLEAAKTLPGLSQSLLAAAELAATSKQELDRVRAQTAASLEATYGSTLALSGSQPKTTEELLESVAVAAAAASQPANDDLRSELQTMRTDLTDALERLRTDNNAGHAATAGNTGRVAKKLDDVTSNSGGDAISTVAAA